MCNRTPNARSMGRGFYFGALVFTESCMSGRLSPIKFRSKTMRLWLQYLWPKLAIYCDMVYTHVCVVRRSSEKLDFVPERFEVNPSSRDEETIVADLCDAPSASTATPGATKYRRLLTKP